MTLPDCVSVPLTAADRRAPERMFSAPTSERSRATLSATAQYRWEPLWVLGSLGRSCGALRRWCSQRRSRSYLPHRRARCAALIQGCPVHEWSWNAPSLFSKHQRAVAPRRSRAASSSEGRSVGAPCERAHVALLRGFIFWHSWGSSAHQLTVLQNNPRHTARTITSTSAATTIQMNAFCAGAT